MQYGPTIVVKDNRHTGPPAVQVGIQSGLALSRKGAPSGEWHSECF
jgi:hypothetical protein